jgi:hypothetical protein
MWLVITSGKKAAESDNKETDSPLNVISPTEAEDSVTDRAL